MRDTATTLGIIAAAVAVASLFFCTAIAPFIALGAIVLSILAIRGGAKGWGIAGLVVAGLVIIISAALMHQVSRKFSGGCFVCGGKGWVDCAFCVDGRLPSGNICPFCNGEGKTICTFCNGTGKAR